VVFGIPMRIFVSACGVLVVALTTITGALIWWRKCGVGMRQSGSAWRLGLPPSVAAAEPGQRLDRNC
jgi:hypothetical protein